MSDEEDYSSSSDEDYVPDEGELVSEEENSGDEEDLTGLQADADEDGLEGRKGGRGKRKKKHAGGIQARKRKGGIRVEEEECNDDNVDTFNKELQEQIQKEQVEKKEEVEKKRSDDLWSSFLSDVGSRPKPKSTTLSSATSESSSNLSKPPENTQKSICSTPATSSAPSTGKLTVVKEYDFAGETVRVTKDVDVNTKEGQKELRKLQDQNSVERKKDTELAIQKPETSGLPKQMPKKPLGGGLSSVLSKLGKKDKISTLEKSKLDWESFKHKEGIDDELKIHNRGKEGYIERLQFLNRTDQRQFEIERNLRLASSSKR